MGRGMGRVSMEAFCNFVATKRKRSHGTLSSCAGDAVRARDPLRFLSPRPQPFELPHHPQKMGFLTCRTVKKEEASWNIR